MHPVATHRLDAILAPDYLAGLTTLPIEELRRRRNDCQEVEVSLSYLRRVVQGRLDIVLAEMRHRREGSTHDLQTLVDELPSILSEKVHAGGNGRLSRLLSPGDDPEIDDALLARIDAVVDDRRLSNLPTSSDADIDVLVDELQSMEADISAQRRSVHERIDALQAELVRRYKSGEANVNTLLS
jgi:septum formation topological specificity factor MinE